MFFSRMQKFNLAAKTAGKCSLERVPADSVYALWAKHFVETFHAISHRLGDKCSFAFHAEIQDGHKWPETDFGKECQLPVNIPWRSKILSKSLYLTPFLKYQRFFNFIIKKNCAI